MKVLRKISPVAAAALFGAALIPRIADSQSPGRPETTITLAEPTEIPGTVLEPGTYILKITENQPNWNVVTVESAAGRRTVATVLATPHTVANAADNALLVYFRLPAGQNRAIRSWFPAGEPDGEDFVYTKERSEELARLSNQPPPGEMVAEASGRETSTPAETETRAESSVAPPENPSGSIAQAGGESSTSTMGSGEEKKPETMTADVATARATELPRTASPFPLLALLGVSALGLGLAVRRLAV